jgi:hypothetical protein
MAAVIQHQEKLLMVRREALVKVGVLDKKPEGNRHFFEEGNSP